MKKLNYTRIAAACSLALAFAMPAQSQIIVEDPLHIAEAIVHTGQLAEQIAKLKLQLDQLKKTHDSLNGMRQSSELLKDDLVKQAVPLDYKKLLDAMDGKGGSSITGKMDDFTKKYQITACEKTAKNTADQKACKDRWSTLAAQNAMGQSGYDAAYKDLENMQKMLDAIKKTKDPKEIADLQARLQLQQIKAQNESNKMQSYQVMLNARKEAAQDEQRNQIQSGAGKRLF